ncbi:hypothetical protein [Dechloromonas denitrificans]|uniref:hypothetical protein n=1 Tax=Dechloromonas denitrificans TaxID=281362 RepID=UPI001CF97619|nr:hypothetical protein [Dechloromonas denitrificans]UCV08560.1 hypothetical protein KI615_03240 [Dechloromonas denitrificans]
MDTNQARKLLNIQIEHLRLILGSGFGVNHAESTMFDIINIVKENNGLRGYFIELISETLTKPEIGYLDSNTVPGELIELATHELRWPEFQALANNRIDKLFAGKSALAISDISRKIADAYSDDWPDREFYAHYN